MRGRDILYLIIGVFGLLVAWLINDKLKYAKKADRIIKNLRKDNHEIKTAYLSLFEKYLSSQQNVDIGLIQEVQKLKSSMSKLDFEVHVELESLINDLNNGKAIEAVRKLAKIVESKLKEKVKEDRGFKGKKMLHNLLVYAKKCEWISLRQFENAILLRDLRNSESHELDVVEDSKNIGLSIYSGIDIIYTLK